MARHIKLEASLACANFHNLEPGKFGPYAAVVLFSLGSFLSSFVFNIYLMGHPFKGHVGKFAAYFAGGTGMAHIMGILGGIINCTGTTMNKLLPALPARQPLMD